MLKKGRVLTTSLATLVIISAMYFPAKATAIIARYSTSITVSSLRPDVSTNTGASGIVGYALEVQKSHKYDNLTKNEIKAKEETKIKVNKMLSDAETDIIETFNINKNQYVKLDLKNLSDFSQGKFDKFNDSSFCKKASKIISNEMNSVSPNSLVPTVLINSKELIFAYKTVDGANIIKKYELKNNNFEKTNEDSKKGKKFSLE